MFNLLLNIVLLFGAHGNYDASVLEYLHHKVKDCSKIEVTLLGDWNRYSDIKINNEKDPRISGNIAYIPVTIKTPHGENGTSLSVEIKKFDKVLVAKKDINRFEELTVQDFELKLCEITLVKEPVRNFLELENKISSEFIREGEALSGFSLTEKPIINLDERLTAHSIEGNVDVSMIVYARQSGKEGDVIRVRSTDNTLFRAKVLDKQNVLIIE